jgi:hypothetical protein
VSKFLSDEVLKVNSYFLSFTYVSDRIGTTNTKLCSSTHHLSPSVLKGDS